MSDLMQVFTLLCGLDYSGQAYVDCVNKSKVCVNKEFKHDANKKKGERLLSESNKETFYKCYAQGKK